MRSLALPHPLARSARRSLLAVLLACVLLLSAAAAQSGGQRGAPVRGAAGAEVRLTLGVAGQPVAEAWNPLRLELRDSPPATLTLQVDQGTLRTGEVPLVITHEVRGGAGISIFEELVYLPRFARLAWRLGTPERVLASGSIDGRDSDDRPVDLLLSSSPGTYQLPFRSAFGGGARLVDVTATDLPSEPAAYDGVRSLIIDGSAAAPRLEAVAAAASGGALVVLSGPLPASHADLSLLTRGGASRLGAGAVAQTSAGPSGAVELVNRTQLPRQGALLAALLEEPLVELPTPLKGSTLVMIVAGYALLVLLLLNWAGSPGVVAALALAGLVSAVGWQLLRPPSPELHGEVSLALAGDGLALTVGAREVVTLPRASISLEGRARPLRRQAYRVDDAGTHVLLERWRSVVLQLAPTLNDAQLALVDDRPVNLGRSTLYELYRVGEGAFGDLQAGAGAPVPTEGGDGGSYSGLIPLLPEGAWLARSECVDECTVWVAYPPLALAEGAASGSPDATHSFPEGGGPFGGVPTGGEEL